ncbi:Coiled-coil-helix-coiled-coil-helix domain-containing protein 1 [Holothuria leucospilota]|uniref:Coiled-coil-helix-coiled-coil-helix domain-containing protein 1 n=1 Tax=Holothuria leucospilota TaxID=206669 RepID=A0A9Q0YII5_HOLLE|nr:Coiled-coil-helix-coiled-coil-helix domain-containing protein 1 [Holothuria leucospilota]
MAKRASEIVIRNTFKPEKYTNMNKPFKLRDRVSLRRTKQGAASCISEMAVLMSCWKENDYSDKKCSKELETFNKCVAAAAAERKAAVKAMKEETSHGSQMTSKQVTRMLQKYPQPT